MRERVIHVIKPSSLLSVVLNQIFHKLRVSEVDGARVVLVHLSYLSHIVIAQREVEDVDVLRHALLMARLGNSYDASLDEPTKSYLSCSLIVLGTDRSQQFTLYDAVSALSTEWIPSHHLGAKLDMNRFDARLLRECAKLQLVHHRFQLYIVGEVEETACPESC